MMTPRFSAVRGRFAPSPSGPLHFGSLIAAVGSYLNAKSQQGEWLVRIEDIDTPRTVAGAADQILHTLESFGLHWDDTVVYQSKRLELYQQQFDLFLQQQAIYPCSCSRARIASLGGGYDGHCRHVVPDLCRDPVGWRLKSQQVPTAFHDLVFAKCTIPVALANEDYVVKRRDGLFAYQWVVVIDDIDQRISEVIRGADLLSMTPRQQALFQQMQAPVPAFGHLPLAASAPGVKLSKQNHASALAQFSPSASFAAVMQLLGQPLPTELIAAPVPEQLAFALHHWQLSKVPNQHEVVLPTFA